ncbi:hypothetical protein L6R53_15800 [Myxococcota bacterium]|nr:hypothetical protein [Myxococcota bacterium]
MRVNTEQIRTVLDWIDDSHEEIDELGGRRRSRRKQRRAARKRRRAAKASSRGNTRRASRLNRKANRLDPSGGSSGGSGASATSPRSLSRASVDEAEDEGMDEGMDEGSDEGGEGFEQPGRGGRGGMGRRGGRGGRGGMGRGGRGGRGGPGGRAGQRGGPDAQREGGRFRHEDQELAMPDEDMDDVTYDEEEVQALLEDDVEDIADITESLVDQAVTTAGHQALESIAGDLELGRITPGRAKKRVRAVRRGIKESLQGFDGGRQDRRTALRRHMVQRLQGEISGFGGDVGCSACAEAYGQARLSGVHLAGRQAAAELGRSEFGFVGKAAKGVAKAVGNLAEKLKRDPSKVAERRERRAAKHLQRALERSGRGDDPAASTSAAWGPETRVGTDLVMRAMVGRQGAVLDLGNNTYLVANLTQGEVERDPRGARRRLLNQARAAIEAKLSPVGLLQAS